MKKISKEDAIKNISDKCQINNITFLGFVNNEWKGSSTYLSLKCNQCGLVWTKCNYSNFIRNRKCPHCSRANKFKNSEKVISDIRSKCINNNSYFKGFKDGTWNGITTYLKLKCNKCGNEWDTTRYIDFMTNKQCPKCQRKKQIKPLEIVMNNITTQSQKRHLSFIKFENDTYLNNKTNVILKCDVCENIYKTTYVQLLRGTSCKQCRCNNKTIKYENIENKLQAICNERNYSLLGFKNNKWIGAKTYLQLKCNNCGSEWNTTTYIHLTQGRGCPVCRQSILEKEIKMILNDLKIDYNYNYHPQFLNGLELDFFIPSKNIAIECQGLQHFQPVSFGEKDEEKKYSRYEKQIKNDNLKFKLCEKEGIRLIYFSNLHIQYPYDVIEDINKIKYYLQ